MILNFFVALFLNVSIFLSSAQAFSVPQDLSSSRLAAEKGDARAQLEYGKAIQETSREEAARWIQKAANQGLGEAWYQLGYAGLGHEKPVIYYMKAAEAGYREAFGAVLEELLFRAGASADVAKAKRFADLARQRFPGQSCPVSAKELETVDRCFEAGPPVIPASDQPSLEERKAFTQSKQDCRSLDSVRDRKCLLSKEERDNVSLAEIYANGWGVKRDVKLATALVCHGNVAPAELESMVEALHSSRNQERLQNEFNFCDHVTSGSGMGICAERMERMASQKREKQWVVLVQNWKAPQKDSLRSLRRVADDFFSERARSEQDLSGTAREQIVVSEEVSLREGLLQSVRAFEAGKFPIPSDLHRADRDLNEAYSRIMKKGKRLDFGTVTQEGIRVTQRKWLKYRDAWVSFARLRYPAGLSEAAWKAWLTRQRGDQLQEFVPGP